MGTPVELHHIVSRAQAGDTDAFGQLYDKFLDTVYRFVYFRVGKREDAEDLTEQIFVHVLRHIQKYEEKGIPFEAWLFRIARNMVIDHYRTHKSNVGLDAATEIPDHRPTPEELTDQQLAKENVFQGMRQLPDSYREIIVLTYIEEKDNKEISAILEKPVAHIRVLQSRAIQKLRTLLHYEQ